MFNLPGTDALQQSVCVRTGLQSTFYLIFLITLPGGKWDLILFWLQRKSVQFSLLIYIRRIALLHCPNIHSGLWSKSDTGQRSQFLQWFPHPPKALVEFEFMDDNAQVAGSSILADGLPGCLTPPLCHASKNWLLTLQYHWCTRTRPVAKQFCLASTVPCFSSKYHCN